MLAATLLLMLALQGGMLWQGDEPLSPPVVAVMVLDSVALALLLRQRRLRDCFDPRENPSL